MRIITCEQVSAGHPDKLCDQVADAIVTDVLKHDRKARVAIEVMAKDEFFFIAGELTSYREPDYGKLIHSVLERIGENNVNYDKIRGVKYHLMVRQQSPDIAMGVDSGGAGDQGMMYGYATNETVEMLPMPFVLATKLLEKLERLNHPMLKADAKTQCSFDYDSWKIKTFLCSVQHLESVEPEEVRPIIRELMSITAREHGLNDDFEVLVNPTGRFTIGGAMADCGVTGRKLACDTYGGVGRIGGGAMSGKDPTKVDRSGAYMARKIARDIVLAGYADRCEVQIAYAIGVAKPVSVNIETFGTEHNQKCYMEMFVRDNYDLTPQGMIKTLGLLDVDYNLVSSLGHFGKPGLPWEV